MAIKLPSFKKSSGASGPNGSPLIKLKKNVMKFLDKMPYHYWIIAAGVVSMLLAVALFFMMDDNKPEEEENTPKIEMVSVVTAASDINARATIKDSMLVMTEFPASAVPEGAFRDKSDVLNLPASMLIMKGDVITDKKVLGSLKEAGFTGMIPPDCRAISINISDVTGVAGFAKAGDYVDILLVSGDKSANKVTSNIVLQNVLLLGINKSGQASENKKPSSNDNGSNGEKKDDKDKNENSGNISASRESMSTATLAVTPAQAMQIAAASQKGILYLTLRPLKPRDNYVFDTTYTVFNDNNKNAASAPKAAPAPAAPKQSAPAAAPPKSSNGSIEVYRGTASTREGR